MQKLHNNAKTTIHGRAEIQAFNGMYKDEKCSVSKFCRFKGISRNTFYKWHGRDTLHDISSRPHTIHYKITNPEELASIAFWRVNAGLEINYIKHLLKSTYRKDYSEKTLQKHIQRNGLYKPRPPKKEFGKFPKTKIGFIQADVVQAPKIKGQKSYIYTAIERSTRLAFAKVYTRHDAKNAVLFFAEAIKYFQLPVHTLLTDNGREFTNANYWRGAKNIHPVDAFCYENDIEHRRTKPAHPYTNGMVERFNLTLQTAVIFNEQHENLHAMEKAIENYIYFYNFLRPHGQLYKEFKQDTTPAAAREFYKKRKEFNTQ